MNYGPSEELTTDLANECVPNVAILSNIHFMTPRNKRLFLVAKAILALVIIVAVGRHFANTLNNHAVTFDAVFDRWWKWIPVGLLYLGTHTTWGTFWWMLMRRQGVNLSWKLGLRTYFVSQFGKYVPGKAWVLVLRAGLLRSVPGATPLVVGVTSAYETIVSMASGSILAGLLVPLTGIGGEYTNGRGPFLIAVAGLPIGLFLLIRLINRIGRLRYGQGVHLVTNPPVGLLLLGLVQAAFGWCLLALSVRLAIDAVVPGMDGPTFADLGGDLATIAVSYVVGFVVLVAPGGLGPREYLLSEIFAIRLAGATPNPASQAVLFAIMLRLVWTTFEVAVAGSAYLFGRRLTAKPEEAKP